MHGGDEWDSLIPLMAGFSLEFASLPAIVGAWG